MSVRTVPGNFDVVTKLASLTIDLDTVVEELLKGSTVEEAIAGGFRVVDDELMLSSRDFGSSGLDLHSRKNHKEKRNTQISLLRR